MKGEDIWKDEPAFPDSENVKSETLVNKDISILAYADREGADGEFVVIQAKDGDKEISFSNGGKVVVEKVRKARKHFKMEDNEKKLYVFPSPVDTKLVEIKSKEGRTYYNLE